MITYTTAVGSDVWDIRGLSTDEKPANAPNGSTYYEINTGKVFMFDGSQKVWIEQ